MDEQFNVERALKGKRKGGHLENWLVRPRYNGDEEFVVGMVTGDNRFYENEQIYTSPVVAIHEKEQILETRNTYYTLGKKREQS